MCKQLGFFVLLNLFVSFCLWALYKDFLHRAMTYKISALLSARLRVSQNFGTVTIRRVKVISLKLSHAFLFTLFLFHVLIFLTITEILLF